MAVLTGITNKRFDAASLAILLEKLKGTYGSIQDIIDAINDATFEVPEGTEVDTTHTIKFIGEDGLNTILQLIKDVKDNAGTGNVTEEQLNALETSINTQLSALSEVVEAMNEDVNDLSETSASHTTSIGAAETNIEALQITVGEHTTSISDLEGQITAVLGTTNPIQYVLTTDTELVEGKTYYTEVDGVYTTVETPSIDDIASYYELVPAETREYNSLIELERAVETLQTEKSDLEEQVENNTTGLTGIVDTANDASFTEPTETAVDTTHTIKFIGEAGIGAILQLIKNIKENCESQFATMGAQLDAINGGISSLSGVVEAMNEDVNDLVETSASHTASINEITTWINEFNDKITE